MRRSDRKKTNLPKSSGKQTQKVYIPAPSKQHNFLASPAEKSPVDENMIVPKVRTSRSA